MAVHYKPGDIIYAEEPIAQVLYFGESKCYCDCCFRCKKDSLRPAQFKLKVCTECRYVSYCSKKCQKTAWRLHKRECPHLKNLPSERSDFIRLVGLVLFAIEGKEWRSIKVSVGDKRRSFADLISNCHITKNDPKLRLYGLEMAHLLKEYLGEEIKLDDDQLQELIGKVKHNRYGISGRGCGLYIGASIFEHSCLPLAVRSFQGPTIIVRANSEFVINIERVTISYTRMVALDDMFAETKKSFYGPCTCWNCNEPYGDSPLTKIVDHNRAFSVIQCTELALEKLSSFWTNCGKPHYTPSRSCSETRPMKRSDYEIGLFLDKDQEQALKILLEMQKNVLGDTNILRIRLLLAKAIFERDLDVRAQDLLTILECVKNAFGDYSEELLFIYDGLANTYLTLQNFTDSSIFYQEYRSLRSLLYGKKSGSRGR